MKFAVSLATETDSLAAARATCAAVGAQMGKDRVDLALLFVSLRHGEKLGEIVRTVRETLRPGTLLGCTAAGVIGGDREVEGKEGFSLWAASLPGVRIEPFRMTFDENRGELEGWPAEDAFGENSAVLLFPDPFSIPADQILATMNDRFATTPVIGGLASGAVQPGDNRLVLDDKIMDAGAVGVVISGAIRVRTVVSQGCRPVGKPFVITGADRNVIQALGGKPALQQLQELFATIPPEDQKLFRQGVHVGRVVDEMKSNFVRGDFLIRNMVGIDPESGAIAIGDFVRRGQTIQFHVRDAASAHEDLRALLEGEKTNQPAGALLFSCNGRGTHLFGQPHQDAVAFQEKFGELPVAGFFAAGEIGPVGGKNFLHGFTASALLFGGGPG